MIWLGGAKHRTDGKYERGAAVRWVRSMMVIAVLIFPVRGRANDHDSHTTAGPERWTCADSTSVVVRSKVSALPKHKAALNAHLMTEYVHGPDSKLFDCPVHADPERAASFERSMVRKASEDSLDGNSLSACLQKVMSVAGRNVYLPVSATYTKYGGDPVWVILVKWEWAESSPDEVLSHSRAYVMDSKTTRQLGFATCD